jgi:hypothetical protein
MCEAALVWGAHGFPVFPVTEDKIPVPARDLDANGKPIPGTGSFKKATTDPAQIRAWWRRSEHLIGLPMGYASGVCCIDVDTSEDHADGVAEWEKIAAQHEPIVTREHRSATGGPHLIFDFEQPIGCSTGDLPAGIEVKGEGSYIVVPPSRRKGRAYTVHRTSTGHCPDGSRPDHGRALARRPTVPRGGQSTPGSRMRWGWIPIRMWAGTTGRRWAAALRLGPFDQWSQKSKESGSLEAWEQIEASPPDRTGAGAIFRRARAAGWTPRLVEWTPATGMVVTTSSGAARIKGGPRLLGETEAHHARVGELAEQGASSGRRGGPACRVSGSRAAFPGWWTTSTGEPIGWSRARAAGGGATGGAIKIGRPRQRPSRRRGRRGGGRRGWSTVDRHLLGDKIEERLAAVGCRRKCSGRGATIRNQDDDVPGAGARRLAMKLHADISGTCCVQRRKGRWCRGAFTRHNRRARRGSNRPRVLSFRQKAFGDRRRDHRQAMWAKGIRGIEREAGDIEWTVPLASLSRAPTASTKAADKT